MSVAFLLCVGALFFLAAIGMPIAYATILSSVLYLAASGQDLGIAGEQVIYGIYDSFVLLAVPLFIVAANIMNAGTVSEKLLDFCVALVGRFKGGLGHVNVVANLIMSGMSGSAVADAAGLGKVIIEKNGPVKTIWMNRPEKRNALDSELLQNMIDALGAPSG